MASTWPPAGDQAAAYVEERSRVVDLVVELAAATALHEHQLRLRVGLSPVSWLSLTGALPRLHAREPVDL